MLYAGFVTLNCVAGGVPNAACDQGRRLLNAPAENPIERVQQRAPVVIMNKMCFNQQMTDFNG